MAAKGGQPFFIPFPSHHEELADALAGKPGAFLSACQQVEDKLGVQARVVLDHIISRANATALPDFVRFVDDRFPGVAGIRLSLSKSDPPESREQWEPWLVAALWACRDREVGFILPADDSLPETVPQGLSTGDQVARDGEPLEEPEALVSAEVVLVKKRDSEDDLFNATAAALELAGGVDSLVRPSRGYVPSEVLWLPSAAGSASAFTDEEAGKLMSSLRSVGRIRVVLSSGDAGPDRGGPGNPVRLAGLVTANGLAASASPGLAVADEDLCSALVSAGVDEIRCRLDEPAESGLSRVLAWRQLADRHGSSFLLETVVTADRINRKTLDSLLSCAMKVKPARWRVSGPVGAMAGIPADTFGPGAPDLELLGSWLLEAMDSTDLAIEPVCLPVVNRLAIQRAEQAVAAGAAPPSVPRHRGCPAGVGLAVIDSEGRLAPCPHLLDYGADLRAAHFDLATIWSEGEMFGKLRNSADITGRCGWCEYRGPCYGCRAVAGRATGQPLAEDPWCRHAPLRPARDKPLVLIKVATGSSGAPEPEVVTALASRCRQAGTEPHVAAFADAQGADLRALQEACARLEIPFFTVAKTLEVRKGETVGRAAAREVPGLIDYDQILAAGRISTDPFSGAIDLPFALVPPEIATAMSRRLLDQLGESGRLPDSRTLEGLAGEVLLSLKTSLLLGKDHLGRPLDLAQTIPTGLYVLELPTADLVLAGSRPTAMDRVAQQILSLKPQEVSYLDELKDRGYAPADPATLRVSGVPAEHSRSPMAVVAPENSEVVETIAVDKARCTGQGNCRQVCPTGCIELEKSGDKVLPRIDAENCIRCAECVEFCPEQALCLVSSPADAGEPVSLAFKEPGWLAGLADESATEEANLPPTWQQPRKFCKRLVILGLSMTTQQHHGAALVIDGEVVGGVEEERFRRRKQFGWFPQGRPGATVVSDPSIPVEHAFPRRSVEWLLQKAGLQLDDVDCFAVNGIHGRFCRTYSLDDHSRPPEILQSGRFVFVPHHLAHAASAVRVAGYRNGFAFTVDGRGERETAAFFEVQDGNIHRVFDLLVGEDSLIGGVYETVTRILGFGKFGQGSTMGLAALPHQGRFDFSGFLSARTHLEHSIRQRGIAEQFGHLQRSRDGALSDEHIALAASVQRAVEETVISLIEEGLAGRKADTLCLSGGVALNCRMNLAVRRRFEPGQMFLQPAAHDAGTALGAALEAHHHITGDSPDPQVKHGYLGPEYNDLEIRTALEQAQLPFERCEDIARATAQRVADGRVVCWFQGPLEFGPRALGSRSVLADPRSLTVKERCNVVKGRQWWRPFGPSILEGREAQYFEPGFSSPFMLFTVPVRKEKWDEIPAVLHLDQTTRPQSVRKEENPLYHEMISEFEKLTGVPMVLNTSFNTAFEPIVNSPEDAIASFLHLGADWLAIGNYLVERNAIGRRREAGGGRQEAGGGRQEAGGGRQEVGGRRLMLRLTTRCNSRCEHCTVADIAGESDRSPEQALAQIAQGRKNGCTELVFMRGEPTLRKDLPALAKRARTMGYTLVQVQTNGRILAYEQALRKFLSSGINFFEVSLYADKSGLHDRIAGADGAFEQTVTGIGNLSRSGCPFMVTVPVLKRNYLRLPQVASLAHKLGVKRIQFNFARPVKLGQRWNTEPLVRLSEASAWIRQALELARSLGLDAATEGVPFCHLREFAPLAGDQRQALAGFSSVDLHRTTESVSDQFRQARPLAAECSACRASQTCPTTWAAYQNLFGTWEFSPLETDAG